MQYTDEPILKKPLSSMQQPTLLTIQLLRLQYLLTIFDRYDKNSQSASLYLDIGFNYLSGNSNSSDLGNELRTFLKTQPTSSTISELFSQDNYLADQPTGATVTDLIPMDEVTVENDSKLERFAEILKIYAAMRTSLNVVDMETFKIEQLFDDALKLMQTAELSAEAVTLIIAFINNRKEEVKKLRIAELQSQAPQVDLLTPAPEVVPKTEPSKAAAYASYQTATKENQLPANGLLLDFLRQDDSQSLYLNYVAGANGYTAIP
ncbi:MAG: hypothetical protein NXI01_10045 [Gammaproteobacteria bacterium]|nr:hypothetical protein [Gammaproteobacteria bacterium]